MNKRGDVPIVILVLGTFVICTLALLSFYSANVKVGDSLVGLDLMESMNSKINEYNFYEAKGLDSESILSLDNNFYITENSFLINETFSEGYLFWEEEKFLFSVEYFLE